jgi:hypothetical protein
MLEGVTSVRAVLLDFYCTLVDRDLARPDAVIKELG